MGVVTLVIAVLALLVGLLALVLFAWLYGRMYYMIADRPADQYGEELDGGGDKREQVPEVLTQGSTQPPGKA
jgi:hypothetical protein